jgi:hypothetical protein
LRDKTKHDNLLAKNRYHGASGSFVEARCANGVPISSTTFASHNPPTGGKDL